MRRETAERLTLTIDKGLCAWLDDYAHDQRTTKSRVIEELVEELQKVVEAEHE